MKGNIICTVKFSPCTYMQRRKKENEKIYRSSRLIRVYIIMSSYSVIPLFSIKIKPNTAKRSRVKRSSNSKREEVSDLLQESARKKKFYNYVRILRTTCLTISMYVTL